MHMSFFKLTAMLCLSLVMFACQPEQAETAKPPSEGMRGTKNIMAPIFSGKMLDGTTYTNQSLAGKAYIVNFFASWCPPCRAEVPDMVELQKEYEQKGFTFVGVTVDEDLSKVKDFVNDYRINFPVVAADKQIIDAYSQYVQGGLRSIPTSFVVGRDGSLSRVLVGAQSKAVFDGLIRESLGTGGR